MKIMVLLLKMIMTIEECQTRLLNLTIIINENTIYMADISVKYFQESEENFKTFFLIKKTKHVIHEKLWRILTWANTVKSDTEPQLDIIFSAKGSSMIVFWSMILFGCITLFIEDLHDI